MGFLQQTRTRIHSYLLEKKLQSHQQSHCSIDMDSAKSIGILFDGTLLTDRESVQRFARQLKQQGKEVKMLAIIDGDQKNGDFVFTHFTKKEVDWIGRPTTQLALDFANHPFDILINLAPKGELPLEYIAAFFKS